MNKQLIVFVLVICLSSSISSYGQLFQPKKVINPEGGTVRAIALADFDGDTDLDIVTGGDVYTAWYENVDGQGSFVQRTVFDDQLSQAFNLVVGDVDNDNDIDIIVSYFGVDEVILYKNLGGGTFASGVTLFSNLNNCRGVALADLDGDNDLDLVIGVTNGSGLYWSENLDGNGNYGNLTNLDPTLTQARLQLIADVDGDDDLDIVSNGINPYITWYENTDGQGTFSTRIVIDPSGLYHNSMTLVDFDLDDDPDILASVDGDKIILFENDGTGVFAAPVIVNDQIQNPNSMIAVDVDNDLDLDIVCQSGANEVIYLINEDGLGNFGNIQFVDDNLPLPRDVAAGDMDGDGDQDIVTAALEPATGGDRSLVWYENRTILGVTGFELAGVSMTPNPAKDTLSILSKNHSILEVAIYQLQGQELLELQEGFDRIDVSNLATGNYLVSIITPQGKAIKKLVKE